ncbi:MAG TPA: hypothetical protein VMP13_02610 [Acidimicrobiia bacterium]|nr:hypothetical protein [Acidimicrobiia bacterium]
MSETAIEPSPQFRPSLFHIALAVPWIAVVVSAFQRIGDNSFLWHIRAGELQAVGGAVLTSDPFSFTAAGEAWRTQSWLVELLYAWLETRAGLSFTGWMVGVVSALTVVGLGLIAHRYSRSVPATSIVLLLSAVLLPQFLVPRPVLFSFLFFVLVILAWDHERGLRWSLPLLFWLWASVHGSFIVGLGYLALRVIKDREPQASQMVVVSGLATLMTAHGLGIFEILWDFVGARPYLALISEWQTPNLLEPRFLPMLLAVFLIVYGAARGRVDASQLWLFAPFFAFGVSAERAVVMGWIALLPMISLSLRGMSVKWAREFPKPVAVGFVGLIALLPMFLVEGTGLDDATLPVAAAGSLEAVRTFHDDFVGGYLIWLDGPQRRVYIDDRAELYQNRLREFLEVRAARTDWQPVFERNAIEQVLLRNGDALLRLLEAEGWRTVYRDEVYSIMRP